MKTTKDIDTVTHEYSEAPCATAAQHDYFKLDIREQTARPYGFHSPKTGRVYTTTEAASMDMAGETVEVYSFIRVVEETHKIADSF